LYGPNSRKPQAHVDLSNLIRFHSQPSCMAVRRSAILHVRSGTDTCRNIWK